ncbi:hypothetical protein [Aquimonas sp.]|jgi:hypothetical protein|uniref:hypothetical protein n=1 Tax=Aquimonas sp. TaxID=1872588 RepID=UPI0037C03DC4
MRPNRTLLIIALAYSGPAQAAILTVDTSSDAALSACTEAPDDCSLRGAIQSANGSAGADEIQFDIPDSDSGFIAASSHWRIAVGGELVVTAPLTIDGFTQPGAAANSNPPLTAVAHALKIELRGPGLSGNCMLGVSSLSVRGLALGNCNNAVFLFEPGPHVIEGNHIGVDISGEVAAPNRTGIALGGQARIGGSLPAQANVISANQFAGMTQQRGLIGLRIQGNVVGATATLAAIAGAQDYAIQLIGPWTDALIGGSSAAEANILVGSRFNAISASASPESTGGAAQLRILGNLIGTNPDGVALGNGGNPSSPSQSVPSIQIGRLGHCRVAIGGDAIGEGNLFAYGANAAVAVNSCWGAPIIGNAYLANRGQAIDLATTNNFDGRTPNDPGDLDGTGTDPFAVAAGNRLQNTAEVSAIVSDSVAGELRLSLRVDSSPSAAAYPLRLDFYRFDEATILRPALTQTYALASAQQVREYVLPLAQFSRGVGITVTDAAGNTGEMVLVGELFADGFESP